MWWFSPNVVVLAQRFKYSQMYRSRWEGPGSTLPGIGTTICLVHGPKRWPKVHKWPKLHKMAKIHQNGVFYHFSTKGLNPAKCTEMSYFGQNYTILAKIAQFWPK